MIIEIPDVYIIIAVSALMMGISWAIAYTMGRSSHDNNRSR
jgi:hypothetical protein